MDLYCMCMFLTSELISVLYAGEDQKVSSPVNFSVLPRHPVSEHGTLLWKSHFSVLGSRICWLTWAYSSTMSSKPSRIGIHLGISRVFAASSSIASCSLSVSLKGRIGCLQDGQLSWVSSQWWRQFWPKICEPAPQDVLIGISVFLAVFGKSPLSFCSPSSLPSKRSLRILHDWSSPSKESSGTLVTRLWNLLIRSSEVAWVRYSFLPIWAKLLNIRKFCIWISSTPWARVGDWEFSPSIKNQKEADSVSCMSIRSSRIVAPRYGISGTIPSLRRVFPERLWITNSKFVKASSSPSFSALFRISWTSELASSKNFLFSWIGHSCPRSWQRVQSRGSGSCKQSGQNNGQKSSSLRISLRCDCCSEAPGWGQIHVTGFMTWPHVLKTGMNLIHILRWCCVYACFGTWHSDVEGKRSRTRI